MAQRSARAPDLGIYRDRISVATRRPRCCQVTTTLPERAAADRLAAALVEERWAACAQVVGPVESTYRWKGKVERATEWYCHLKTTLARAPGSRRGSGNCIPYETPEIIAVAIVDGDPDYLRWIAASVSAWRLTRARPGLRQQIRDLGQRQHPSAPPLWTAARGIPYTTQLASLSPIVTPPPARIVAIPSAPSSPMPVSRMPSTAARPRRAPPIAWSRPRSGCACASLGSG